MLVNVGQIWPSLLCLITTRTKLIQTIARLNCHGTSLNHVGGDAWCGGILKLILDNYVDTYAGGCTYVFAFKTRAFLIENYVFLNVVFCGWVPEPSNSARARGNAARGTGQAAGSLWLGWIPVRCCKPVVPSRDPYGANGMVKHTEHLALWGMLSYIW